MLLWQSEKETAITRLPQCEKGRTGFTAQKDNCIYGIDAEGANISFFVCLIIFFSTTRPCCWWISRQHRANRQVYKRLVSLKFSLISLRIPPADNLLKRIDMKIYVSFLFSQIHFHISVV